MKSKLLTLIGAISAVAAVSPLNAKPPKHKNVIVVNNVDLTDINGLETFTDNLAKPFHYGFGKDNTETIILNLADPITLSSDINFEFGLGEISPEIQYLSEAFDATLDLRAVVDHQDLGTSGDFTTYEVDNDFDFQEPINNEYDFSSSGINAGTYDQIVIKVDMTENLDPFAGSFTVGVGDFIQAPVPETGSSLALLSAALAGLLAAAYLKRPTAARISLR